MAEARLGGQVATRVDEPPVRRRKDKRVRLAGERLRVVAVIGDEDVVPPIAVEVGNQDLTTMLCPWDRAGEEGASVSIAATPIREEDADRKGRVGNRERKTSHDEIGNAVSVQVACLLLGHPPDALRRGDRRRSLEHRHRLDRGGRRHHEHDERRGAQGP